MLMFDGAPDVTLWQETYGFTFPVLDDSSDVGASAIGIGDYIPHHVLIGRDMTVKVYYAQPTDSEIQAALDEEWPEVEYPEPPTTGDDDDADDDGSELDLSGLTADPSGNPFEMGRTEVWDSHNMCAVGTGGRGASLLALLLPLIAWRRWR